MAHYSLSFEYESNKMDLSLAECARGDKSGCSRQDRLAPPASNLLLSFTLLVRVRGIPVRYRTHEGRADRRNEGSLWRGQPAWWGGGGGGWNPEPQSASVARSQHRSRPKPPP